MDLVSELKGDLCIVTNALAKIKEDNDNNNLDSIGTDKSASQDQSEQPVVVLRDGGSGNIEAVVNNGQNNSQIQTIDIEEIINAMKDIQSLNQSEV